MNFEALGLHNLKAVLGLHCSVYYSVYTCNWYEKCWNLKSFKLKHIFCQEKKVWKLSIIGEVDFFITAMWFVTFDIKLKIFKAALTLLGLKYFSAFMRLNCIKPVHKLSNPVSFSKLLHCNLVTQNNFVIKLYNRVLR